MIYFITFPGHRYTVGYFFDLASDLSAQSVDYNAIDLSKINADDTVVFTDIDRCNDEKLKEIILIYDKIKAKGCRCLNNPRKVLRRLDLSNALYQKEINKYRMFRIKKRKEEQIKYPVFIRSEFEHNGPLSSLLFSSNELETVIKTNRMEDKELVVVEYIDATNGKKNQFNKYGAFYVNGKVIPRHFYLSSDWNVKNTTLDEAISVQLEKEYCATNPHEAFIKQIFEIGKIDFGRIDYALTTDGFQVFEINTNPMIIEREDVLLSNPRRAITLAFKEKLEAELQKTLMPYV